jgi:ribosomal-protein-alanine N-acetyltransferase
MTEAVRAVIRFGFRTMNLNRIQGRCEVENIASVRVMEKAGMRLEGVLREHEYSAGKYLDIVMYSILRREWGE